MKKKKERLLEPYLDIQLSKCHLVIMFLVLYPHIQCLYHRLSYKRLETENDDDDESESLSEVYIYNIVYLTYHMHSRVYTKNSNTTHIYS